MRIEEEVNKDPAVRDRLARAEERKNKYLAEHLDRTFGPISSSTAGGIAGSPADLSHTDLNTIGV